MVNQRSVVNQRILRSPRLAWLEGIRFLAVLLLLLYHAQLLFTNDAYTPQPTGLLNNLQQLFASNDSALDHGWLSRVITMPAWFGFQFVDGFVLISGFCLTLSLRHQTSPDARDFLKQRFLRLLMPLWTVAALSYLMLWAIATATHTDAPLLWHVFAGATFPLLFSFSGEHLLYTSAAWWHLPLMISFALVSPFLWYLLHRWGARNLLIVSLLVTLLYRLLAVYPFGGQPTYVVAQSFGAWEPFLVFLSKLSTFVVGMLVGKAYCDGGGPVFWKPRRALMVGVPIYALGFVCQFYRPGWVVADLLVPIGLMLICMVLFRAIAHLPWMEPLMRQCGSYSYSYFLIYGIVVDRTMELVIQSDAGRYWLLLPVMLLGALILAAIVDYVRPGLQRFVVGVLRDIDYVLTRHPVLRQRDWNPQVGESVFYQGDSGWMVVKIEKLLDEREFFLCKVSNGARSLWVNEDDLEPDGGISPSGRSGAGSEYFSADGNFPKGSR